MADFVHAYGIGWKILTCQSPKFDTYQVGKLLKIGGCLFNLSEFNSPPLGALAGEVSRLESGVNTPQLASGCFIAGVSGTLFLPLVAPLRVLVSLLFNSS